MSYNRQRKKRITGKHPDECDACEGLGQTRQGETVTTTLPNGAVVTARDFYTGRPKCGSGCLRCGGTGRLRPNVPRGCHVITDEDLKELRAMLLGPSAADLQVPFAEIEARHFADSVQ